MDGIDVGLSAGTFRVWVDVLAAQGVEWSSLATPNDDPVSLWAWRSEAVAQRFHPSILRRLAERALDAGAPVGEGEAWTAAGGDASQWLELQDLLRALRAHTEVEEVALLVGLGPTSR